VDLAAYRERERESARSLKRARSDDPETISNRRESSLFAETVYFRVALILMPRASFTEFRCNNVTGPAGVRGSGCAFLRHHVALSHAVVVPLREEEEAADGRMLYGGINYARH